MSDSPEYIAKLDAITAEFERKLERIKANHEKECQRINRKYQPSVVAAVTAFALGVSVGVAGTIVVALVV